MPKEVIHVPSAPPAIGPYSRAVKAGNTVYVSGCIGISSETNALVPGGIGAQTKQVMENLKAVVEASGSTMSNVVKCTILLTDMSHFAEVNGIYAQYFPVDPPARCTFAVAGLPANAVIEIDCICIVD